MAKKKTRRGRVNRTEIMAMHGEKPLFANFDELTKGEQTKLFNHAMGWYHGVYSTKESKEFLEEYVKKNRTKSDLAAMKSASLISPTWGNVAKMFDDTGLA